MEPLASAVTVLAVLHLLGLSAGAEGYLAAVVTSALIAKGPLSGVMERFSLNKAVALSVILLSTLAIYVWLFMESTVGRSIAYIGVGVVVSICTYVSLRVHVMNELPSTSAARNAN